MGGSQSTPPQTIPGFEKFPQLFEQAFQQGMNFNAGSVPTTNPLSYQMNQLLGGVSSQMPQLQQGLQSILGGVSPELLMSISDKLRPALVNKPFDQGSAAIKEQQNAIGNFGSSGTQQGVTDLLSQLEQNLGNTAVMQASNILGTQGQNTLGALNSFGNLAQFPSVMGNYDLNRLVSMAQFGAALPGQIAGQFGGLQGIPLYQPRESPGMFSQLLPVAGGIAGSYLGGPGGGALGNKLGGALSGGGGGGGGQQIKK